MKKITLMLFLLMLATALLSSCGEKKDDAVKDMPMSSAAAVEETNPENGLPLSKQPDPNAEVLASIVIYVKGQDDKLSERMEAADALTGENIIRLLIENGVLSEGTEFVSLEESDGTETVAAGPAGGSAGTLKDGRLTLTGFSAGEGLSEELARQAVTETFVSNYELGKVELVVK